MPKFSEFFNIDLSQAMLDFVDIDTDQDKPLFIEPYSFVQRTDLWSIHCLENLVSFFQAVIDAIQNNDEQRGQFLLDNLGEPNETCLGLSQGSPSGRGIGGIQAGDLYARIKQSKAARSGLLEDLCDCELFVEGIGRDKVSDMATNIIRNLLIQYTQEQCRLHNIPTIQVPSGAIWNIHEKIWTEEYTQLPTINGKKIILVPKASVRWRRDFSHHTFYNQFVLEFLQDHHLNAQSSLVETLKNGRQRVTKKSLKELHPISKDFLSDFAQEHPEVLLNYKRQASSVPELENSDFDSNFNQNSLCSSLIDALSAIDMGNSQAHKYHSLITGILEFIFYPHLIYPEKENEIHEGRKRIDIKYTNNATIGFFARRRQDPKTLANCIVVECKNYSNEVANPELDQLSGRFSPLRGRLGILTCRQFDNKQKFIARCKDTAKDDRGLIIVFDDQDIIKLLNMIKNGHRTAIDQYLETRYEELIA